ncbi:MAG: hypothetical protein ACREP9_02365, partial [Candidatus Dormibacteraceae bacterium]
GDKVTLEAKKGKIIIRKNDNSRAGWASQIKSLIAEGNEPTGEFNDMYTAANDGLDSLPWDGPSFEDWQKTHGKIS